MSQKCPNEKVENIMTLIQMKIYFQENNEKSLWITAILKTEGSLCIKPLNFTLEGTIAPGIEDCRPHC